ncbi:unnamed protein product [Anisakis simplex]|uniref:Uncharacterized protein n=1 Tax=Anisakis simplex TaxID=6269 RepID=A0A0M3JJ48_ANISI|nr:unnamed protein product [Anisakis simplex]
MVQHNPIIDYENDEEEPSEKGSNVMHVRNIPVASVQAHPPHHTDRYNILFDGDKGE